MNFKTFYSILSNRISDGANVPNFVRDLIAMITSVPEEEWNTKKDPSNRVNPETYRNYSKRGIPKKLAVSIVDKLSRENFIESINQRPPETLEILSEDIKPYNSSATKENVAEILADIFINIIKERAGQISSDLLIEQKQKEDSENLKAKFGKYLLRECNNHCAMNGCGKPLFVSDGFNISDVYEISKIDKAKSDSLDNLIALCPSCFYLYQLDGNKSLTKDLKERKKYLSSHLKNIIELSPASLGKGLTNVIIRISKLKQTDIYDITLEPHELQEKIDPDENLMLYNQVKNTVITYYGNIKDIFLSLDKSQVIDYEETQLQMKAIYKKLKKTNKSQISIFNEISEKLHNVTLQDRGYCQIIVCYFIQSCEVFDAITK